MITAEAAEVAPAEISELLTWAEICARHPDEWVCLVEMEFTGAVFTTMTHELADWIGYSARDGIRRARVHTAIGSEEGYLLRVAELNYEIRSAERRILVEKIQP
jgi:hypothetical protein